MRLSALPPVPKIDDYPNIDDYTKAMDAYNEAVITASVGSSASSTPKKIWPFVVIGAIGIALFIRRKG